MEYHTSENGFLEEILAFRNGDPYGAYVPLGVDEFYNNGWNTSCFEDNNPIAFPSCNSFQDFSNMPFDQSLNCSFNELYHPFVDEYTAPEITTTATTDSSSNNKLDDSTPPAFLGQEEYSWSFMEDEEQLVLWGNGLHNLEVQAPSKVEPFQSNELAAFNMGLCPERKNSIIKKLDGQPSKNLMAERRRRKRLNDRLSMLRSVVPKISKMDRTSILGDTIDYVKELLERINKLQEEIEVKPNQVQYLPSIFEDVKPNEIVVRNSPKFDVERRNADTRIEISCAGKPGLLLSTVTTLEALGLEIQQCVISCFNDFAMQASCSEELEARAIINSEDIKQALFRNAGYGGRCL